MTIKNKIANYLGLIPKQEVTEIVQKKIQLQGELTECNEHYKHLVESFELLRIEREKDLAYWGNIVDRYNKPEPKLKSDVKQIIAAILSQGYKQIGYTQDEFMYIYQFATVDKMFWLQVNYGGEYVYLMHQVNNQDVSDLCNWIITPNRNKQIAQNNLETLSITLEAERKALEIASESTNTVEYRKLTTREKKTLNVLKSAVAYVREVSVLVRDL